MSGKLVDYAHQARRPIRLTNSRITLSRVVWLPLMVISNFYYSLRPREPPGRSAGFLAEAKTLDPRLRLSIGRTAALSATCIMLVALAIGRGVLELFNISIADFMTAGGIIIFVIALKMVLGPSAAAGSSPPMNEVELRGFGIVPLGTTLLAGPGVIGAVILRAAGRRDKAIQR
jgi:small neutral amino acid transporter SnatA (MarC family)